MSLSLQTTEYKASTCVHITGMSAVHLVPENSPMVGYAVSKWWSVPQLGLVLVVRVWSGSDRGHAESGE